MWLFWIACTPNGPVDSAVDTDEVATVDADPPFEPTTVGTVSGSATWGVDFSAAAEAAGYVDCDYSRSWSNGLEDQSTPWLCPTCGPRLWRVDAAVVSGREACYDRISANAPAEVEWLGVADGAFYRANRLNLRLSEQGAVTGGDAAATLVNDTDFQFQDASGGTFDATFHIEGALTFGTATGDPAWGMRPPAAYACGWPKRDRAAYAGDYRLDLGEPLPDGVFDDACGEPVRLDDLGGEWLVVDVAARDCGPCRVMAEGANAFVAGMAAKGVQVRTVTLLAPTLSDTLAITPTDQLVEWADGYALTDPVLADRGYGVWVMGEAAPRVSGEDFGYPTWAVVGPDGNVRALHVGFGSWDAVAAVVDAG
jgi:hypothetical protein